MRICSPSEFVSRWPGCLRPVHFPEPSPALPSDAKRVLTEYGLPRALTIHCYNDITLSFAESAMPLAAVWKRDLTRGLQIGEMPKDWARFWHLADQQYLQGGGWICIEQMSGRLVVIDLDCREPIFVLSSSVENFYTTLAHFLDWTENTDGGIAALTALRDGLRTQNCLPREELEPFWLNFIDATLDDDAKTLAVSLSSRIC